jgi:hypothetical protein
MGDEMSRPPADQYRCEHGHAYYDGDQGVGSPRDDGFHDAQAQHVKPHELNDGPGDPTYCWEPWERNAYRSGYSEWMGRWPTPAPEST